MYFRFTAPLSLLCMAACLARVRADETGDEFFEKKVRPILVARCFDCHSGTKSSGGLSLASKAAWQKGGESGQVIAAGKPDESLLIAAIEYKSLEMPPPDKGGKLPEAEIAILREWVTKGAPDPRVEGAKIGGMNLDQAKSWWAFQALPDVTGKPATSEAIDQSKRLTPPFFTTA
jgi:mono/diheme cytochrome c family protein